MSVSDVEINSEGKSYTALTLTKLKEQNADTKFYFVVGADSLCYMDEWKTPEIIFRNAEIILISRKDFSSEKIDDYIDFLKKKYDAVIHKAVMDNVDISSSFLREELKMGRDISKYTGKEIYRYIMENMDEFELCY
jgi:nicotinate-nucleotide adenylyltransferase